MSKFRVVRDGHGKYIVQQRILFWWLDQRVYKGEGYEPGRYDSKEEAEAVIQKMIKYKLNIKENARKSNIRETC